MTDFTGAAAPLSADGLARSLDILGVGAAEVWTVLTVETSGFGFLPDRRPLILFERHIFSRQTKGIFDAAYPLISSTDPGGYAGGAREYQRLHSAIALNQHAALNSASWGIGQVMGFNSNQAGFDTVEAMVEEMVRNEDAQLKSMAHFMRAAGLDQPLRNHDWPGLARAYNGPAFRQNRYDTKLADAYQKLASGPLPDLRIRRAQALLTYLGIDPNGIDGIAGNATRQAVARFREQSRLAHSGEIDDDLIAALRDAVDAAAVAA